MPFARHTCGVQGHVMSHEGRAEWLNSPRKCRLCNQGVGYASCRIFTNCCPLANTKEVILLYTKWL